MKKQKLKIPRKIKKQLKKKALKGNKYWKSKELKITSIEKNSRYSHLSATFKGLTATGYTLGCNKK